MRACHRGLGTVEGARLGGEGCGGVPHPVPSPSPVRPTRGTSALCAPELSAGPVNELTTSNDSDGEMGTRVTLARTTRTVRTHAQAAARVCRHFDDSTHTHIMYTRVCVWVRGGRTIIFIIITYCTHREKSSSRVVYLQCVKTSYVCPRCFSKLGLDCQRWFFFKGFQSSSPSIWSKRFRRSHYLRGVVIYIHWIHDIVTCNIIILFLLLAKLYIHVFRCKVLY